MKKRGIELKDIVIYGFGGFAGELAWLIEDINQNRQEWNLLGFLDDNANNTGKEKNGYKVLGGGEWLVQHRNEVFCAAGVGNGASRKEIFEKTKDMVLGFPAIIHPAAKISRHSGAGSGSIICAGCIITVNVKIRDFVIVNLGCTIGHDAILDDYTTVAPGVHISGNAVIGKYSDIGTGAVVIQNVKIGDGCVIGAAAAVVRDIPDNCTAVGVPARVIKSQETQ